MTPTAEALRRETPEPAALARSSVTNPRVVLPVVAIAAVVGVLVATTRYGIGLTPDSVVYITGARSLADGRGYTHLDGGAIGSWPPGYSFVLSLGERIGIDALDGAVRASARSRLSPRSCSRTSCCGDTSGRPGCAPQESSLSAVRPSCSRSSRRRSASTSSFPFSRVHLGVRGHARAPVGPATRSPAAVFLAWAAFYLRYAGIVTSRSVAYHARAGWRTRRGPALLRAGAFVVARGEPPGRLDGPERERRGRPDGTACGGICHARRATSGASRTRHRSGSRRSSHRRLCVRWSPRPRLAAFAGLSGSSSESRPSARGLAAGVPLALVVVVYIGYLVASASIVAFGAINTRFMLPVFVPYRRARGVALREVRDQLRSQRLRTALTLIGIAWVVVNVMWFAGRAVGYAQDGAGGYATERWDDSALMQDVERLDTPFRRTATMRVPWRSSPTSPSGERRQDVLQLRLGDRRPTRLRPSRRVQRARPARLVPTERRQVSLRAGGATGTPAARTRSRAVRRRSSTTFVRSIPRGHVRRDSSRGLMLRPASSASRFSANYRVALGGQGRTRRTCIRSGRPSLRR